MGFRKLYFAQAVRRRLDNLPPETVDCLLEAFHQIKDGRLELTPATSLFRTTVACDHLIAVSVVPQDVEAEVVGLHFMR